MRAKEFISEQHRHVSGEHYFGLPLPTTLVMPDASENFYHMYRFGLAMSKDPNAKVDLKDQAKHADSLAIIPYTEEELAIVQKASKAVGAGAPHFISRKGKKEEDGGHSTSPVAKFVPTRRPK